MTEGITTETKEHISHEDTRVWKMRRMQRVITLYD